MQRSVRTPLLAFLCLLLPAAEAVRARSSAEDQTLGNPIRKVVTMLQNMQKKVQEEGEKEKELYEKFMCFCKSGGSDLQASISSAEMKVPSVSSNIEESEGKLVQLKEDLKQAQSDRSTAKDTVKEATALREKEAAAYAAEKAEYDANIAAINKAVAALEKGMAGSFLQSGAASELRQIVGKASLLEADRQELLSFLTGSATGEYAPKSGEITGLLKQLGDTMSKSLADATASEEAAIKSFQELAAAKAKEIAALTGSIESKTEQIGELGVAIVSMKEDLSDTEAALAEDQKYFANLKESCDTKTSEWEERSKTRAEELVALAEVIKVLNDDDALELFKKTLPSAGSSLVQFSTSVAALKREALAMLGRARGVAQMTDRTGLDVLVLALTSAKATSKGGFDKVIKMIDNMVAVLKQEQFDDDHKQEYCQKQFDLADDKKKTLERTVSDTENAIETAQDGISTLTSEIAALEAGIAALDKSVAEATEQRKKENEEFNAATALGSRPSAHLPLTFNLPAMALPALDVAVRRSSRRPLAAATVLLALSWAVWTAAGAAFVQAPAAGERISDRRQVLLGLASAPLVAVGSASISPAEAAGARWSGKYDDPKFPGCDRRITKEGDIYTIRGTSPTDGTKTCKDGAPVKRWELTGKTPEGTWGSGDTLIVDFSSRGGPTEVIVKYDGDGIVFPGPNKWFKKAKKPGTTGLVSEINTQ